MKNPPIDFELAVSSPQSIFTCPEDVIECVELNTSQKIEILISWECDARELSNAEEEGMAGGEPSMLNNVLLLLSELRKRRDGDHSQRISLEQS